MHSFVIPLVEGTILVLTVLGIGEGILGVLNFRALPWHWHLAFAALSGQLGINSLVQTLLLTGTSSTHRLKLLGWSTIIVGLSVLAFKKYGGQSFKTHVQGNTLLKALICLAWLANLAVALAPSSKLDEIFYHMVVPKRIAAEGSLNYYRLPIAAAIVPQMQYQISMSPAYALGAPESGNLLSLGYSIVLGFFIIGLIQELTGNDSLALLGGLACIAGAYQTVWHTTEGPTAIGELGVVVALCGVLWPRFLSVNVSSLRYGVLLTTAAALAASTKISLIPLCVIISSFVAWRVYRSTDLTRRPRLRMGVLLVPWILIHIPLMVWTYHESGSFWGPVMANVIGPSVFPIAILRNLDQVRVVNQKLFFNNLRIAAVLLCPLVSIGIVSSFWSALRGSRISRTIIGLFTFQAILIWWQLPYDFRFLGGLVYIPIIATIVALSPENAGQLTPTGRRTVELRNWIAVLTVLPWVAFQIYYARPFVKVVIGISSRKQFRERYVALAQDYEVLDRILPRDAVLYVANGTVSLFDAPRPVVLTPLDLRQKTSLYRLTVSPLPDTEAIDAMSILNCKHVVYVNSSAIIETYRLPGRSPKSGTVTVQGCQIEPSKLVDYPGP